MTLDFWKNCGTKITARVILKHLLGCPFKSEHCHGWTQAELAKRMGTSRSQISQIEQVGIGPRSLKMLYKLCAAFDISLLIQVSFRDLVKHIEKFDIETFNAIF